MNRDIGDIDFPIWIIGDSEPTRWKAVLEEPFDPRHPIRHNIITSVFDIVQDSIFRNAGKRVDTSKIYIRNAVSEASSKPAKNELLWSIELNNEIRMLKNLFYKNNPILILTFGAFAYEFTRRAFDKEQYKYNYWTTERLGDEFRKNTLNIQQSNPVIIPLLHRSIAGGHFIKSHENYCRSTGANYFDCAGTEIANIIMKILYESDIWVTISKTNDV